MPKWIIALILLPLIAYGAFRGVFWLAIKGAIDDINNSIGMFAKIDYDKVYTSYDGTTAGLNGVSITIQQTGERFITADEIHLQVANVFEWLKLKPGNSANADDEFPSELNVILTNLSVPMTGPTADLIDEMSVDVDEPRRGRARLSDITLDNVMLIGCNERLALTTKDLMNMGYSRWNVDVFAGMQQDQENKAQTWTFRLKLRDAGEAEFIANLDGRFNSTSLAMMSASVPGRVDLELNSTDLGFIANFTDFCGNETGLSAEEFVDRNIELLENAGLTFSDSLKENYRSYMLNGGTMKMSATVTPEIDFRTVEAYNPDQQLDLFNVQFDINGKQFNGDDVNIVEPKRKAKETKRKTTRSKRTEPLVIDPKQLRRYVGKTASLELASGIVRTGVIRKVRADSVTMSMSMSSGIRRAGLTFSVDMVDIKKASILD